MNEFEKYPTLAEHIKDIARQGRDIPDWNGFLEKIDAALIEAKLSSLAGDKEAIKLTLVETCPIDIKMIKEQACRYALYNQSCSCLDGHCDPTCNACFVKSKRAFIAGAKVVIQWANIKDFSR